jgi:hypothetical protein
VLAKNSTVISEHLLSKKVRIGIPGFKNVIRYRVAFNTPKQEIHRLAQFEVLTGYMPVKFRKFYGLSTSNGTLSRLSDGPGEQNSPVILSTKNGDFAMGALSVSAPERIQIAGPGYGRFAFDAQKVTKWNVVYRIRDSKAVPTGVFQFEVLVVIGDLETVRSTLFELVRRN